MVNQDSLRAGPFPFGPQGLVADMTASTRIFDKLTWDDRDPDVLPFVFNYLR